LLVLARHRPGDHFTSFTWVLVPATAPGVAVEPADTGFFAGSGIGHVWLDGVRLSRDHVVGRVGQGLVSFGRHIATERLAGGLWAAAIARRALAGTHDSLLRRTARGRTLWDNDAVRLAFARCLVEHRRLEAMCRQVADAISGPDALLASMLLKAGAADALEKILTACSQMQGADGFRTGGIQQLRAEAAMFGIAGGTTETMLAAIADRAADLLAVRPS
jgi:citronellyl-CoA dehydrogenase